MKKEKIAEIIIRIEKLGERNRRLTQAARKAVRKTADWVVEQVGRPATLPGGYRVVRRTSNLTDRLYLVQGGNEIEAGTYLQSTEEGGYLHGDFQCWIPPQTRAGCLRFAQDIRNGWLDELAAWLEAENQGLQDALDVLDVLDAEERR